MTIAMQQRAELQRRIWQIANDVRGSVDGWDFKQYVLGTLFYRFISENFANYIKGGDDSVDYLTTLLLLPSKKTPSKQKAILFTQASYLKMSSQQPTLIRI